MAALRTGPASLVKVARIRGACATLRHAVVAHDRRDPQPIVREHPAAAGRLTLRWSSWFRQLRTASSSRQNDSDSSLPGSVRV